MIAATKTIGLLFATIAILLATLFGIASTLSLGSNDPAERKDATISAFYSVVAIGLCAALIVSLSGCMSAKELACLARDNTSNPCN